jgi:PncC family amidohydrolase
MVYKEDTIEKIKKILVAKNLSLSVAESVTSGHLQAAFSTAKDASKFFQGGITAYNAGQKCRHLSIEPIAALESNSVSDEIARDMATYVNELFVSDVGISITGYAARVPEQGINALFAFFAIAQKEKILLCERIATDKEEGVEAQIDFTNQVVLKLHKLLNNKKTALKK